MFIKHKLQASADFKTTLLGSHLSALLWLAKPFYSGRWLVIFSHVKNAIREVDWTYRFFTCENIAHIEFYSQGLLPKILAIYTFTKQFITCVCVKRISNTPAPEYSRFSSFNMCTCFTYPVTYPGFCSMKRLRVFLLPPGWDAGWVTPQQ